MASEKRRILFVCVQNSFRSQIAEAIVNKKYGDRFVAESAGLNIGKINPLAIRVMNEYGIDISNNQVNSVFDFYKEGRFYSYIITVCSREAEKECPVFPGIRKRLNWELENPENITGTEEEKYQKAIEIRDEIERKIDEFISSI
ncbi:MAG: arsenate reductase ArsC [Anaerotignum sp.]|nr:arsenate reductase ArsC [Anaerotignum sp.]